MALLIDANKVRTESMCLEGDRKYQFAIYDSEEDGIFTPGYYNVTSTSDGSLIVKGGDFEDSESTIFSVPYEPSVVLDISAATNRNRREDHTEPL